MSGGAGTSAMKLSMSLPFGIEGAISVRARRSRLELLRLT